MSGWVKLHRNILDWEWWSDHNTTRLFLYLIIKANHSDTQWKGITIKRGSLVFGREKCSKLIGISEQSIRTSMRKLKSTNSLTIKSTSKFSIITICNYEDYQEVKTTDNQQTNQQPNQQLTTSKEVKKKESIYTSDFDAFWSVYPRREGKKPAAVLYQRISSKVGHKKLLEGAKLYAEKVKNREQTHILMAKTWLNGDYWNETEVEVKKVEAYNPWKN